MGGSQELGLQTPKAGRMQVPIWKFLPLLGHCMMSCPHVGNSELPASKRGCWHEVIAEAIKRVFTVSLMFT